MLNRIATVTAIIFVALTAMALEPNQIPIYVNGGLLRNYTSGGGAVNGPMVSVTICEPGTTNCQTIDNVLLDTGSSGLRIFQSANFKLNLPGVKTQDGQSIYECINFGSGETDWGAVRLADVRLGGETAKNLRIQLQQNTSKTLPCARPGLDDGDSYGILGEHSTSNANGILGIRLGKLDLGFYYTCPNASKCVSYGDPTFTLQNPAYMLLADNNGYSIEFPKISSPQFNFDGILTFGVNTRDDNQVNKSTTRLGVSAFGLMHAEYGEYASVAVIDSGTSMILFPNNPGVSDCTVKGAGDVLCPDQTVEVPMTLGSFVREQFAISVSPFNQNEFLYMAVPNLAMVVSDSPVVLLGLPFFFGKRITFQVSPHPDDQMLAGYIGIENSD